MKIFVLFAIFAVLCGAQSPQGGTGVPGPAGPPGSGASTPATSAPICGTGSANSTQACGATPIVTALGSAPVANATNAANATSATNATNSTNAVNLTTPLAGDTAGPAVTNTVVSLTNANTKFGSVQSGADSGQKIAAGIGAVPSTGGSVDASGLTGSQAWNTAIFSGVTKPVTLTLGTGETTINTSMVIPANITLKFAKNALLCPASGVQVQMLGSFDAPVSQQIIDPTCSGLIYGTGTKVPIGWFGGDPTGVNDSAQAANAAAAYAAGVGAFNTGGATVELENGTYLLSSSHYQVVLPQDDGSFGTPAAGTGGTVSVQIGGGVATGCTVTAAGSGYTVSDTLLLSFSWATVNTGSGVTGTVSTNGSGQVSACSITTGGIGVTVAPTATVTAHGGGGAVLATSLNGNSIFLPTISSAGAGFPVSTAGIAAGVTGLTCTTYPAISITSNSSGGITSVQSTSLGTGCSGTPVAVVGNSCQGAQCNNTAPETPAVLGCAVRTYQGVNFSGASKLGTTITTGWDNLTSNNSQLVAFCDPDGKGNTMIGFSNLFFNGVWIGFYETSTTPGLNQSYFRDLRYINTGIPIFSAVAQQQALFTNIWNEAHGGITIGGGWNTRNGNSVVDAGGYADKTYFESIDYQPTSYATVDVNLDKWFETNIWKSQNGPFTGTNLPNGQCFITNSTSSPRITDVFYGQPNHTPANNQCFQGVTGWAFPLYNRNGRASHLVSIKASQSECNIRGIVTGLFTGTIENVAVEAGGLLGGCAGSPWTADPYLPTSSLQKAALYLAAPTNTSWPVIVNGLETAGSYQQSILAFNGSTEDTQAIEWHSLVEDSTTTFPEVVANVPLFSAQNSVLKYTKPAVAFNGQKLSAKQEYRASCSNNSVTLDCSHFVQSVPVQSVTNPDVSLVFTAVTPYGKPHIQFFGTGTTAATANEDVQANSFVGIGTNPSLSGFATASMLVNAVASSATPAFNLALGTYQTNTLTANVTSSTATNLSAGSQSYFKLTENSTGGFTYVWPTNIKGIGQINTAANAVNVVGTSCFDTSNCYATGPVMDQNGNGYFAGNIFANGQQSAIGFSSAAVTLTPGTNITSVTCTSATCDVNGGSLSIVGGALASTGTFATVSYTAIATAPRVCLVAMNGGAAFLGLGHGTPSTTSFTLTSAVSVAATTFTLDYTCKP